MLAVRRGGAPSANQAVFFGYLGLPGTYNCHQREAAPQQNFPSKAYRCRPCGSQLARQRCAVLYQPPCTGTTAFQAGLCCIVCRGVLECWRRSVRHDLGNRLVKIVLSRRGGIVLEQFVLPLQGVECVQ